MPTVTAATLANAGRRIDIVELDVLRGVAAVLMIVNHAGFRLLSPGDATGGASGLAVFIGSFAPVLFFFATGFGIGLGVSATRQAPAFAPTLWKAALLVLADQIGYWASGGAGGLNFFGFIGISMIVVGLVARARLSTTLALTLVLAIVLGRYALGPSLRDVPVEWTWLDAVLGARGVRDVAYPLSPWMVYPLLGFVLGKRYGPSSRRRWLGAGAAVCLAAGLATAVMISLHASFFRWGTVSAAFFVLSLAVLAAAGLASIVMVMKVPFIAARVALRGVASFAVIPLHYALLDASAVLALPLSPALFVPLVLGIAVLSWLGANGVASLVGHPAVAARRSVAYAGSLVALAVLVAIGLAIAAGPLATIAFLLAQLAIAGLLGLRGSPERGRIVTPARV